MLINKNQCDKITMYSVIIGEVMENNKKRKNYQYYENNNGHNYYNYKNRNNHNYCNYKSNYKKKNIHKKNNNTNKLENDNILLMQEKEGKIVSVNNSNSSNKELEFMPIKKQKDENDYYENKMPIFKMALGIIILVAIGFGVSYSFFNY